MLEKKSFVCKVKARGYNTELELILLDEIEYAKRATLDAILQLFIPCTSRNVPTKFAYLIHNYIQTPLFKIENLSTTLPKVIGRNIDQKHNFQIVL